VPFQEALSNNPVYDPGEWRRFFRPSTLVFVPDARSRGHWTTSSLTRVAALGEDIRRFWADHHTSLKTDLNQMESLAYYVPCKRIHEQFFVTSALAYFDFVVFEDPLARLPALFDRRADVLLCVPGKDHFRSDVDRGTELQLASVFFTLWWILHYRAAWPQASDDLRFVVAPPASADSPFGSIPSSSPIADRLALRLLSDIAGDEFHSSQDLLIRSQEKRIPWRKIVLSDEILRELFSTSAEPASEAGVLSTIGRLLESSGFPVEELQRRVSPSGLHAYVGFGTYDWVKHCLGNLLDMQWQASALRADAWVGRDEWPAHIWVMKFLSGGLLPQAPASPAQLAALTLESPELIFLGNLSEEELAFIRGEGRLIELRRVMCGKHHLLRTEIGRAPAVARESARSFLAALDEYQALLQRMVTEASLGTGRRIARKAKEDLGEIGLTGSVGILGLAAAPPWSFILAGVGAVVGGQSARGIVTTAREEGRKVKTALDNLLNSPLSICLKAKRRFEANVASAGAEGTE
jgi:hypothetical protein